MKSMSDTHFIIERRNRKIRKTKNKIKLNDLGIIHKRKVHLWARSKNVHESIKGRKAVENELNEKCSQMDLNLLMRIENMCPFCM